MSAMDLEIARLAELATERWLDGLDAARAAEFEALRARYPTFDVESFEEVAAALHVRVDSEADSLPERIRVRVAKGSDQYFRPPVAGPIEPAAAAPKRWEERPERPERRGWLFYGGWLAAAASLVWAVMLGSNRPPPETARTPAPGTAVSSESPEGEAPPPAPTAVQKPVSADNRGGQAPVPAQVPENTDVGAQRVQFLKSHPWVWQRSWLPGPDPTGERVTGDVIWDSRTQTGYMRFSGLRRNDPNVEQYQLWIFDARRDARFPVDGGVFNVENVHDGDVVHFSARLNVEVPVMFVVTVERRGGVVVSDRSRIAAIAHST
jgi:hypothetical protein